MDYPTFHVYCIVMGMSGSSGNPFFNFNFQGFYAPIYHICHLIILNMNTFLLFRDERSERWQLNNQSASSVSARVTFFALGSYGAFVRAGLKYGRRHYLKTAFADKVVHISDYCEPPVPRLTISCLHHV